MHALKVGPWETEAQKCEPISDEPRRRGVFMRARRGCGRPGLLRAQLNS